MRLFWHFFLLSNLDEIFFQFFFFCEILSTDGLAANSNDQGQDSDEDSEDEEAESYPALRDALAQLGIPEYVDLFESEEMDMETFVS